jgi:hypothetical protein
MPIGMINGFGTFARAGSPAASNGREPIARVGSRPRYFAAQTAP